MLNQLISILRRFSGLTLLGLLLAGCSSSISSSSPAAPLLDSIYASGGHTCGLDVTGSVWCWGHNQYGELGNGGMQDSASPQRVQGLPVGMRVLAAGPGHNCALTASGAGRCWGQNGAGQLGNGTQTDESSPVETSQLSGMVRDISVGLEHTCVLNAVGGVRCWGANTSGQLGVDGLQASLSPVEVTGLGSGVSALSSGWQHTCLLTLAGGVKCWGKNAHGQLGNGTTVDSRVPVDVSGLNFGVKAISAGAEHTCALTALGAVKCWGRNTSGELGNGSNLDSALAQDVSGLSAGARSVAAGGDATAAHSCAVTVSGAVVCWGSNDSGQLGDGTTSSSNVPVTVQGLTYGMRAVTTGGRHACALSAVGGMVCWGDNQFGQLGDGSTQSSLKPVEVK